MRDFTDDLRGSISVKDTTGIFFSNKTASKAECEIFALLIYKDKYLDLQENNARRVFDL